MLNRIQIFSCTTFLKLVEFLKQISYELLVQSFYLLGFQLDTILKLASLKP